MKPGPESSYRVRDGCVLIEIELSSIYQMFNTLDPAPFYERDIDADAEEYIVSSAREISLKRQLKLVIYLPEDEVLKEDPELLANAIHHYFGYRMNASRRDLRHVFRQGRSSLMIGLVFLILCIGAQSLVALIPGNSGFLRDIIREGLLISGWVAMWKPIQIFLYDWWPVVLMIRVYRRLSRIEVEIRPSTELDRDTEIMTTEDGG